MMQAVWMRAAMAMFILAGGAACTHTTPTIAHTHIGHAITAFDGTPGEKGLFVQAEARAEQALDYADRAVEPGIPVSEIKRAVDQVVSATVGEDYGLRKSITEAESHVAFAAGSDDASVNVRDHSSTFSSGVKEVVGRCDLIALLSTDVLRSSNGDEVRLLSRRIHDLAYANLNGGVSATGEASAPGVKQLRAVLDDMVASENPPYQTVDRWYLFHLVRLPNCENCWAWRKWANSSNRGY